MHNHKLLLHFTVCMYFSQVNFTFIVLYVQGILKLLKDNSVSYDRFSNKHVGSAQGRSSSRVIL